MSKSKRTIKTSTLPHDGVDYNLTATDKDNLLVRMIVAAEQQTKALEKIAAWADNQRHDQQQFKAIFIAYLNSPLSGLALGQLGETGEHLIKLRNEILEIIKSK